MLTIRKEQMQALNRVTMEEFEVDMVRHLMHFFPNECAAMGDKTIRAHVRDAISRAREYDVTCERDLCEYLNLAMIYGWDFDADPELEWMRDFLIDPEVADPGERMRRLHAEALYRLELAEEKRRTIEEFEHG